MRQISFILILISFFVYFPASSCEKEPGPVVIEEETDTIPKDTLPEIVGIYISNQADFDRFKNLKYLPGANIFFAAGKSFNGQFAPKGSGNTLEPITVTAYNPETNEIYWEGIDNKPIINGHGKVNSAFYLYNGNNWIISNLELTNTDGSDGDQGDLRGIHVVEENVGIVENITIRDCYIHDVNGKVEGKHRGGIHIHVLGKSVPISGNLERWSEQGVLLLNASLTVRQNEPGSHARAGWTIFTDEVIKKISDERSGVVFLLWGNYAQEKQQMIDETKHFVLKAAHPSPLSAHRGFFGCKHFSKTNEILMRENKTPIDWKI